MPDYSQGKIYKIECNITGKCYIGSTTKTLSQRLRKHETNYRVFKKGKDYEHYITVYEILEKDDYRISLLQTYPCENNRELLDREGWYQKKYWDRSVNKCLNGIKAQEEIKKYHNDYYKQHKHETSKPMVCGCGKSYTMQHLKRHETTGKHQNWLNNTINV